MYICTSDEIIINKHINRIINRWVNFMVVLKYNKMLLARQIPAISSCPLSQVEQTFLLFLLCFQKSKFFMVEDLCRFWHLWTDFNYANVPSIYTFLSRNIYYILLYYCLPHFGLTYIIHTGLQVMFLAFRPEFRGDLHLYFFSLTLDAFVTWCYLSNLTTKNASWNLLFSRCVCPTVRL